VHVLDWNQPVLALAECRGRFMRRSCSAMEQREFSVVKGGLV